MSNVAQMARDEADATEAELGTENPPSEPEPEPEPTPEPEPEPAPVAFGPAEQKKVESAIAAHRKKLGSILGDEAVAVDCFVCAGLGHLPTSPPEGTRLIVRESDSGATFEIEPPDAPPDLPHAARFGTCDVCNGYGQVLTGAKPEAPGFVTQCPTCHGNGYTERPLEASNVTMTNPNAYTLPAPLDASGQTPPDAWGRPAGHQHYGVHPASITG